MTKDDLIKKREELAPNVSERWTTKTHASYANAFRFGWDACMDLLWPEVERLRDPKCVTEKDIAMIHSLKEQLTRIEEKWNCEHCRAAYKRGGCPDHGPSIIEGIHD